MPGAGGSSHLIEILVKLLGSEDAKRKMKETGDAAVAMNEKISDSAKDTAKLYTALAASTARIGSLLPTSLPFGQLAKDMTRLTSASLGTASAMKGLNVNLGLVAGIAAGALAGVLALKAAFDGLRTSIAAAAETQESIIKLGNAYRTLGVYSREAVSRGTAFANSMQAVTKYSDEEILSTQALLAQLGRLSGEGLERATRATLDLASGLGRELPVAALIMAKAAQGSTWELRKYGLVLDENLPKTERWAAALKFVETQFGGRAQEEIRGFNATIRQFGGAFKDVLTIIGAPIIIPATKAIQSLTQEMLKFSAARDKMQNEKLLPDDNSVEVALAKLQAAEKELEKLNRTREQWNPFRGLGDTGLVDDEEFTQALKRRQTALNEYQTALAGYVRQIPLDKAIEQEKKFKEEMIAAAEALSAYRKSSGATEEGIQKLEEALRKAVVAHANFTRALNQRFSLSYEDARQSLLTFIGEENKLLQPKEQQITVKGDVELEDIGRRVDEFFKDPKNIDAIERAGKQNLPDLEVTFKALLEKGDPEEIVRFINEAKRKVRELGPLFEVTFDANPANASLVKKYMDFLRGIVEKEGVAKMAVILDQDSIKRIRAGLKSFRQSFQFKGEQIELFDFDETLDQMKGMDEALAEVREQFAKINQIQEPKEQVRAYNQLMQLLSDLIPAATERSKKSIIALGTEMEKQYRPIAKAAALEAEAIAAGTKAREEAAGLRKRFQYAIAAEDWTEAIKLAQEFSDIVSKIEVGTVRIEFEAELQDWNRRLEEAQKRARKVSEEVSQRKTLFRLYLELEQWDAAQEQIEAMRALLDQLPEEKRIELQLFIEKSELDKIDAKIQSKQSVIRAAIDVGRTDIALEKLEELRRILDDPALTEEKKVLIGLEINAIEFDVAEAQLTAFQETTINAFNSTMQQLMNLPWETVGQLASSVWNAMLDDSISVADAIADVFRRMVDDILSTLAKLAVQSAIASAFGIPFLGSFTGGFLGKTELPTPEKPKSKPSMDYDGPPLMVPVEFVVPDFEPSRVRVPSFRAQWPQFDFAQAPIRVPVEIITPEQLKKPWGTVAQGGREVQININAIDTGSIRRQLETGDLGRELSRLMR